METGFLEVSSRKRKRRISDNRSKLPNNVQNAIEKLFEKKFCYEKREDYSLKVTSFNGNCLRPDWQIKDFMGLKNELNVLKNQLNDKNMITWHEHTRLVNLAGNIAPEIRHQVRPELCTQAWCKFYEIASFYLKIEDRKSFVTVHLCEAPGAFVTSLNHYLYTHNFEGQWQWLATTLNPYYEGNNIGQMIDEDRFIRCSYGNWYFGQDGTGNLMSDVNLAGLKEKLDNVDVDLVTADGSIDCQGDPAEQENVVSRLQHSEVLTALHILSPGGTLVVKMFTLFECKAISLMYVLSCVFDKVEVFKPCTSKGGNSEVYVIGLEFKGREYCEDFLEHITPLYFGVNEPNGCLFAREDIPESFLHQHTKCVQFFKDCQMSAIQRNLDLLEAMTDEERSKVEEQKDYCMECFFNRYVMKSLPHGRRLLKLPKGRKSGSNKGTEFAAKVKLEGKFTGSFCERQELSTLPWQQKINKIETYEEEVDREDNSLWIQGPGEGLSDEEVDSFRTVTGKPVDSIQSTRFCHGFYLSRVREIIKHSQWLALQTEKEAEFVKYVAQKLRNLLCETIKYYDVGTTHMLQTLTDQTSTLHTQDVKVTDNIDNKSVEEAHVESYSGEQDGEMTQLVDKNCEKVDKKSLNVEKSSVLDCGEKDDLKQTGMNLEPKEHLVCEDTDRIDNKTGEETPSQITAGEDHPKFTCTLIKGESPVLEQLSNQGCDEGTSVRLYAASEETVCDRFELVEQRGLLLAVQDILKNAKIHDYVVIEIGTCMSRVTAGLVYILYRCFREVGFVHHHGNLLKRHLVCVDYKHCPIRLCQYVEEVDHMMKGDQSTAVLEIIPVLTLLGDEAFTSFLRISNVNLLQSFITTVINQEKQMLGDSDNT